MLEAQRRTTDEEPLKWYSFSGKNQNIMLILKAAYGCRVFSPVN